MAVLPTSFSLDIGHSINHKLVTIGKYDGKNPCLTCGTTAGKVLVHNPHEEHTDASAEDSTVTFLNINQTVTALTAGRLTNAATHDLLLVGTPTNLLAYDVIANSDVFYREVPDGVNAVVTGRLDHLFDDGAYGDDGGGAAPHSPPAFRSSAGDAKPAEPLALVGGNCSIAGLDATGDEAMWTVCGDNVGCMALVPAGRAGRAGRGARSAGRGEGGVGLVVGADDYGLRRFRGEEQEWEVFEADAFVALAALKGGGGARIPSSSSSSSSSSSKGSGRGSGGGNGTVAYGLRNGTVGVYEGAKRVWRVKAKHQVRALAGFDATGDGVDDVASGWSNGAVVVRRQDTGEVLFKMHTGGEGEGEGGGVAAMLVADYRMDPQDPAAQLVVCSGDGRVRGFHSASPEAPDDDYDDGPASSPSRRRKKGGSSSSEAEAAQLAALQRRKASLLAELSSLEAAAKQQQQAHGANHGTGSGGAAAGVAGDAGVRGGGAAEPLTMRCHLRRAAAAAGGGLEGHIALSHPQAVVVQVAAFDFDAGGGLFGGGGAGGSGSGGGGERGGGSESLLVVPAPPLSGECTVPLAPAAPSAAAHQASTLTLHAMCGVRGAAPGAKLFVLTAELRLPKFAGLALVDPSGPDPRRWPAPPPSSPDLPGGAGGAANGSRAAVATAAAASFSTAGLDLRRPEGSVELELPAEADAGDPSPAPLGEGGGSTLAALAAWVNESFVVATPLDPVRDLHGHRTPPVRPGRGGQGRLRVCFESTAPCAPAPSSGDNGGYGGGFGNGDRHGDGDGDGSGGLVKDLLWIEAEYCEAERAGSGGAGSVGGRGPAAAAAVVRLRVWCASLELCSAVVGDLAAALGLGELECAHADFPAEMRKLEATMEAVGEHNRLRLRMAADAADGSNRVKALVVKAEDARLLGDMALLRRHYLALHGVNTEMAMEHAKRATNHAALLDALRDVNVVVERAARLRAGRARLALVSQARQAIKASDAKQLVGLLTRGATKAPRRLA